MKMPTTEKQATGSKNPETKKKESMQKESNPYGIDEWAKQDFEPSNRNQRKDFLEKYTRKVIFSLLSKSLS